MFGILRTVLTRCALVAAAAASATACQQPADQTPAVTATSSQQEAGSAPQAPPAPKAPDIREARQWASKVKASLDQTTLEQLMVQMPDNIQPQASRSGDNRVFTWVFSDGSKLAATFHARGGEGSGGGLVLYMVETE
jgi:hypothetical protein